MALAFALAPDVVPLCRIVMMGGLWGHTPTKTRYAEWNILCDPEAAAMVLRSGADISLVGLDVTLQCVLSDEEVAQFRSANTPRANFLADLIALWSHPVTLHDPLTVLTLFSDLVEFEPKRIEIELCGDERAYTQPSGGEPNCPRRSRRGCRARESVVFRARVGVKAATKARSTLGISLKSEQQGREWIGRRC